jgi:hypothetical protein
LTAAVTVPPVTDDHPRPSPLGGLWAFLGGGTVMAVTVLLLHPVTRQQDCPNWGGNGNASVFRDPKWDLYLPVMALGWLALIVAEQVLPIAWRTRPAWMVAGRGLAALLTAGTLSCCGLLPLETLCH